MVNRITVGLLVAALCLPSIAEARPDVQSELARPLGVSSPAEEPAPEREEGARVRFGFGLGPFLSSTHLHTHESVWFGAQLEVRIGAQITDLFAVYAQVGGLFGGSNFNIIGWGGASTVGVVLGSSRVLAELTLGDIFQIALGPSGWVGEGFSGGGAGVAGAGLTHRVGLALGGRGHGTRQGPSLALQLDLAWFPTADHEPSGYHYGGTFSVGWDTF